MTLEQLRDWHKAEHRKWERDAGTTWDRGDAGTAQNMGDFHWDAVQALEAAIRAKAT